MFYVLKTDGKLHLLSLIKIWRTYNKEVICIIDIFYDKMIIILMQKAPWFENHYNIIDKVLNIYLWHIVQIFLLKSTKILTFQVYNVAIICFIMYISFKIVYISCKIIEVYLMFFQLYFMIITCIFQIYFSEYFNFISYVFQLSFVYI